MASRNLNTGDTNYSRIYILWYLDAIIPLYREIYETMRDHRIWRKKRIESELITINEKRIARKILQKKININCVDNIMAFM